MTETGAHLSRVGVRELRQNLSVYLDRVKAGETLEVTEHGTPVARLIPNPPRKLSILEQMVADGRATPATRDLHDIKPLPWEPGTPLVSDILIQMREEEEW